MWAYLPKRLLYLLPVVLGVSVITFGLINLAPGDPAELILRAGGVEPTWEAVAALREELGLNDPLYLFALVMVLVVTWQFKRSIA